MFMLSVAACARPDYISADEWNQQNKPGSTTCPYQFPATQICGTWNWESAASSTAYSSAKLILDGNLAAYDEVAVVLWMPSMGHGSAPVQIQKEADGIYHITNIYFVMPGEWEIRVTLKKSGQTADQFFIPLMVP